MSAYIGVDLGTSSVKLLLVNENGDVISSASRKYPIFYPQSGWSEQNPEDWYNEVLEGIKELVCESCGEDIKGIGIAGQMHGLVALDKGENVIRPAILWNDGRCEKQSSWLNDVYGKDNLLSRTGNISYPGFTAPKILWMRDNERENFDKIAKIMLPKDYIAYRLTGEFVTDYSDASGTLLLDVKNKKWSDDMLKLCCMRREQLPDLFESYEKVGYVKEDIAKSLGLSHVLVCAGAGDNAAAAVGCGAVSDGKCNISIGTSGTVFIARDRFCAEEDGAMHSFCHANGRFHEMGCILSAASCNEWWSDKILGVSSYDEAQAGLDELLGRNDVFFLPYLMGERCPHNDVNARGAFIGMRADTTRDEMTLAVLEGVCFALKDCVKKSASDVKITCSTLCGGGAKSALWAKIMANVLGISIDILEKEEGPSFGGALLAMTADKKFATVEDAAERLVKVKTTVSPDEDLVSAYEKKYRLYKIMYPSLKGVYASF